MRDISVDNIPKVEFLTHKRKRTDSSRTLSTSSSSKTFQDHVEESCSSSLHRQSSLNQKLKNNQQITPEFSPQMLGEFLPQINTQENEHIEISKNNLTTMNTIPQSEYASPSSQVINTLSSAVQTVNNLPPGFVATSSESMISTPHGGQSSQITANILTSENISAAEQRNWSSYNDLSTINFPFIMSPPRWQGHYDSSSSYFQFGNHSYCYPSAYYSPETVCFPYEYVRPNFNHTAPEIPPQPDVTSQDEKSEPPLPNDCISHIENDFDETGRCKMKDQLRESPCNPNSGVNSPGSANEPHITEEPENSSIDSHYYSLEALIQKFPDNYFWDPSYEEHFK